MDILQKLIGSRARVAILSALFSESHTKTHLREIVRKSMLSVGPIQKELKNLESTGLILSERDGNRLYYHANPIHPLYGVVKELVRLTTGVYGTLREAIGHEDVAFAYVFGSVAANQEKAQSDIDLMVIGELSLRKLSERLSGMADKLGREINPHCFSREEYFNRCKKKDHFITSVIQTKRQVIIGDEDELKRMEKEWMA
jgi:predicted nucleotidyltransferase/predicted transcriptional regulator